ncbi:MAG: hydantoinase/oxoprolinase family protein, partial [Rhodospirillaceae bacterium]|nr:hydantoinase/oxoprolinase family protein [Rhodospirillaceae bacterium]
MTKGDWRLGIDIGGTFTDFAAFDQRRGKLHIHKQLTTPGDPSESVLSGIPVLLGEAGIGIAEIDSIVHGT